MGVSLLRKVLKAIDCINDYTGKAFSWLLVVLVLVILFEVIARSVFNSPTLWVHLTARMTSGSLAIMALAYAHVHRRHMRIDVIYRKLSVRGKMIIDVVFFMVAMAPLLYLLLNHSASWMWQAWIMGEIRTESWWFPPAWPFRAVFFLGLCLFTLQSLSQFFRDLSLLITGRPYD